MLRVMFRVKISSSIFFVRELLSNTLVEQIKWPYKRSNQPFNEMLVERTDGIGCKKGIEDRSEFWMVVFPLWTLKIGQTHCIFITVILLVDVVVVAIHFGFLSYFTKHLLRSHDLLEVCFYVLMRKCTLCIYVRCVCIGCVVCVSCVCK